MPTASPLQCASVGFQSDPHDIETQASSVEALRQVVQYIINLLALEEKATNRPPYVYETTINLANGVDGKQSQTVQDVGNLTNNRISTVIQESVETRQSQLSPTEVEEDCVVSEAIGNGERESQDVYFAVPVITTGSAQESYLDSSVKDRQEDTHLVVSYDHMDMSSMPTTKVSPQPMSSLAKGEISEQKKITIQAKHMPTGIDGQETWQARKNACPFNSEEKLFDVPQVVKRKSSRSGKASKMTVTTPKSRDRYPNLTHDDQYEYIKDEIRTPNAEVSDQYKQYSPKSKCLHAETAADLDYPGQHHPWPDLKEGTVNRWLSFPQKALAFEDEDGFRQWIPDRTRLMPASSVKYVRKSEEAVEDFERSHGMQQESQHGVHRNYYIYNRNTYILTNQSYGLGDQGKQLCYDSKLNAEYDGIVELLDSILQCSECDIKCIHLAEKLNIEIAPGNTKEETDGFVKDTLLKNPREIPNLLESQIEKCSRHAEALKDLEQAVQVIILHCTYPGAHIEKNMSEISLDTE